jgi:hypothetical protein
LTGTTGTQFTTNENIKAIKYVSGITLSSLTANLSLVNGTVFVSNPSVDLRFGANTGWKYTFTSGANSAYFLAGAAGTGETLSANIFSTFNFTSGWTTGTSTIIDADSFSSPSATGIVKANATTTGGLYKSSATGATTASAMVIRDGTPVVTFATMGAAASYATSINGVAGIYLRNSSAGTTDVTTLVVQQVLTPSATGIAATGNWTNSGITGNEASYTVTVQRP